MNEQTLGINKRLISIDVLRGFAMFLILSMDIGGAPIIKTFTQLWGEDFAKATANQFSYNADTGLKLIFMAMPMFLFVVGLVMPFSLNIRALKGGDKKIYFHIIKRSLILFALGLIAGGELFHLEFANMPVYNNVLEYIAIAYPVCAILILKTSVKVQTTVTAALLLLYWLLFLVVPVPGWNGDPFSGQMNLGMYIDNQLLASHGANSCRILSTINFIANILIGVQMGHIIFSNRDKKDKVKLLFIFGFLMIIVGLIWGLFYPIMRFEWTGSYVLLTCGISTVLFASLFQIIDIWGYSKWAFFFVVFGANSIAIYMMAHLFDFRLIGDVLVGGLSKLFGPNGHDFIQAISAMAIMWLIVYWMYRKKTFIKI